MEDRSDVAATVTMGSGRDAGPGSAHVLVIGDGTTQLFPLPLPGVITIGRGPEADLRLEHSSVSRRHARIIVDRREVRVADLDSHNGTRVNGQRLNGARIVTTGDVVAIGEVILVVHAELQRDVEHVILDEAAWLRRLDEETMRAHEFRRSLAILAIADAPSSRATASGLRIVDVVGQDSEGVLLVMLPEADTATARQLAEHVQRAISQVAPGARIGMASCPEDAVDARDLITLARAAVRAAGPGQIAEIGVAVERRMLGDRTVVLGHPAMVRVFDLLKRLAAAELPVLIVGETGVGKENAAFAVHHHSKRSAGPFIAVNCAALSDTLLESQLFGHDKGAFTGASSSREGVFEGASGGTLFLDELGELSLGAQAKLLRVIDTHRVTRLGETKERAVDVRIVAATNRNLEKEVESGRFRQDLYFRLGAARVHLPPLRERRCEIAVLFRELLANAAARAKVATPVASPDVIRRLLGHPWPGNVRELRHVADYLVATTEDGRIEAEDLPDDLEVTAIPEVSRTITPTQSMAPLIAEGTKPLRRLADEIEDLERVRMLEAMARTNSVKTRAAALLGMPIRTFNAKFKQFGL